MPSNSHGLAMGIFLLHPRQVHLLDKSRSLLYGDLKYLKQQQGVSMPIEQKKTVLRVGVFRDRHPVGERIIWDRIDVWIDPLSDDKLCPDSDHEPYVVTSGEEKSLGSFLLFDIDYNFDYVLTLTEQMRGVIENTSSKEKIELEKIRSLQKPNNGVYKFPLKDQHRGKIIVGDLIILFQFVPSASYEMKKLPHKLTPGVRVITRPAA